MFTLLIPLIFLVVAINGLLVPKSLSPIRSNLMLGSTHLLAESSAVTKEVTVDAADRKVQKHAIVCGAGPAGLLSAIMLAQKFPEVRNVILTLLSH
jgi:threonine dehydrogenase-like Zn-dependent dehydrogenase